MQRQATEERVKQDKMQREKPRQQDRVEKPKDSQSKIETDSENIRPER
jgi:hypothetical protein